MRGNGSTFWAAAHPKRAVQKGGPAASGVATGVASHFLQLLEADQKAAAQQAVVGVVVAVALAVPAALLLPFAGLAVHAVAAGVGVLAGLWLAQRRTRAYESSLKGSWQRWMRFAVACDTLPDVARRVEGRGSRSRVALLAAGLTVLWVLELALILLALDAARSAWLAIPVLLLNGALAGWMVGHAFAMRAWTGNLRQSVGDLVESGELGLWGVA